jgi:hypothetical protein
MLGTVSCKSEVGCLPPEEINGTEAIGGIPGDAQAGMEKNETGNRDRRLAHTVATTLVLRLNQETDHQF